MVTVAVLSQQLAAMLRRPCRSMVNTATNPNNTYSSSEVYIIDGRLYTYMACNC